MQYLNGITVGESIERPLERPSKASAKRKLEELQQDIDLLGECLDGHGRKITDLGVRTSACEDRLTEHDYKLDNCNERIECNDIRIEGCEDDMVALRTNKADRTELAGLVSRSEFDAFKTEMRGEFTLRPVDLLTCIHVGAATATNVANISVDVEDPDLSVDTIPPFSRIAFVLSEAHCANPHLTEEYPQFGTLQLTEKEQHWFKDGIGGKVTMHFATSYLVVTMFVYRQLLEDISVDPWAALQFIFQRAIADSNADIEANIMENSEFGYGTR